MSKMRCECGYLFWNGTDYPEFEWEVFHNKRYFELLDATTSQEFDNKLPERSDVTVWICPDCGTLYWFDRNSDNPTQAKIYKQME